MVYDNCTPSGELKNYVKILNIEERIQEIILDFQYGNYGGTDAEDSEIITILNQVFVKESYTDKSDADKIFTPTELRKRGKIKLARSHTGKLLGMAILVVPSKS